MAAVAHTNRIACADLGAMLESVGTIALPVTSGALIAAATWNAAFAWIAPIPLAIGLRHARLRTELCLGLFLGGLTAQLAGMGWMRTAQQINNDIFGPRVVEWLCSGIAGGLAWLALLSLGAWFLRVLSAPLAIVFPVVWVAYEFLWKNGFALVDEVGFPWLQLGASQIDQLWLAQLADVAGVWGVTAVVVSGSGAVTDVMLAATARLTSRSSALAGLTVGAIALIGSASYCQWRLSQPVAEQGPVPALMPAAVQATRGNFNQLSPAAARADFVVWSECAHSVIDDCKKGACFAEIRGIAHSLGKALLVTFDRDMGALLRRSMLAFGSEDETAIYDKHKLVPWNEFTPRLTVPGVTKGGGRFERGRTWPIFCIRDAEDRRWHVAGLICFDACFPEISRGHMKGSVLPDFFVVSACETSDATMALQRQVLCLSRFRAIETRRSVVRNAYGGYSGVIDSCGRLRETAPGRVLYEPWIGQPIPIDKRTTLYARFGDWLPITFIFALMVAGARRGVRCVDWRRYIPHASTWHHVCTCSLRKDAGSRWPRTHRRDAAGFTIIELLVVMVIIGLLLVLVAAAVGAARESARRSLCQNNLRQIGIGLQSYHSGWRSLPPALIWFPAGEPLGGGEVPIGVIDRVARYGQVADDRVHGNWVIALLPQLEQAALYQQFDTRFPIGHARNAQVRANRLSVMLCPSDHYNGVDNFYERGGAAGLSDNLYARGNYAINVGPDADCVSPGTRDEPCKGGFYVDSLDLTHHRQVWGSGIAGANKVFGFADISDGLSQTIAVDEIRAGLDPIDPRGAWALGQVGASIIVRHGRYSNTTGPNPCDYDADEIIGCKALKSKIGVQRLRGECMDCSESSLESELNAKSAARSLHNGGVHMLFCDSSVRFLTDGIEPPIWHALHTRNLADLANTGSD